MTDLKIRQKVALLVICPLVAVMAFAALAVVTSGSEALQADRLVNLAKVNEESGKLAYQLQTERSLAVNALSKEPKEDAAEDFLNHYQETDKAIEAFRSAVAKVEDAPSSTQTHLTNIESGLEDLDSARKRISERKQSASSAAFFYRIIIADLLSYRESVPQAGNVPSDVADKIRAANLFSRFTEYLSIESETVLRSLDRGEITEAAYKKITAANTGSVDARLAFDVLAPPQWREWLEQALSGEELKTATVLEDQALRSQPGSDSEIDPAEWISVMSTRAEKYESVQADIDAAVLKEITTLRDEQYQWTVTQLIGVLVATIVTVLMAVWLGSPVVRGLRRLRDSAHLVATDGLPRAVARLDESNDLDGQTPEEFADRATPPVKTKGRDELADVGRAFNEVHREAIRVAAHQALLRLHIGGMFVRLARRGHSLAGRLTNVLDEAERDEQDPDRLARLFKLDHLVTLFGRTNDSLLVLGGAAPARVRRSSATVGDVLTASQSQIEQYTRVQIGMVDDGVSIRANAVDDVVKLLAELLDNATQYSQHQVNVTARLLADRLVVQISDRGMGIPTERIEHLNARLTSRRAVDLDSMQTMGLTVVGHIAAQHGIGVELRAAAVGGTLAEVSLPVEIIDVESAPAAIAADPAATPAQPAPTGIRNAPLFKRRPRRARGTTESKNNSGSQRPQTPDRKVENNSRRVRSSGGLPLIRFDFNKIPVDPGYAPPIDRGETPTETIPAVPRQAGSERPRRMDVSGMSSYEDSWRAAERATTPEANPAEGGGLPKRDPMSRLVPGAMRSSSSERAASHAAPAYRDPTAVGASYLAYAKTRPDKRSPYPTADDPRNES